MEQQELSINKADIRLTLLTRTSILGACNPKEGRFTRREKVDREYMEDIRQVLGSALLSRFDSIWIITSDMTREERKKRTRYISDLQREYGKKKKDENYKIPEDHKPSLDLKDLKNYIKLGRGITPELTNEALEVINNFMDDLSEVLGRGFIPRQHLALIRYAEASAKAHLREEVLPEDSKRAIELKKDELDRWKENGLDPKDYIEKVETGNTQKELTHKVEVMDLIKLIEDRGEAPTKEKIIEFSKQDDFEEDQISRTIEKLRHRGRIYEKNGVYKLS